MGTGAANATVIVGVIVPSLLLVGSCISPGSPPHGLLVRVGIGATEALRGSASQGENRRNADPLRMIDVGACGSQLLRKRGAAHIGRVKPSGKPTRTVCRCLVARKFHLHNPRRDVGECDTHRWLHLAAVGTRRRGGRQGDGHGDDRRCTSDCKFE